MAGTIKQSPTHELQQAVAIMARLRAPDGCAWDRAQTFESIQRHTLEETYEVFDAIDRRAWPDLKDELGDLLLQVLFYAQMAEEAGLFDIGDVAANLNVKLIRRHPHVFADAVANTPEEVSQRWEMIKRAERSTQATAPNQWLDQVPRHLPALLEGVKIGKRAAEVGFDWPDASGLVDKLQEEVDELKHEVMQGTSALAIEEELGDLLFTAVNLARHLDLEPKFVLRAANAKFRRRFNALERCAAGADALRAATPEQREQWWREVKAEESASSVRAALSAEEAASTKEG